MTTDEKTRTRMDILKLILPTRPPFNIAQSIKDAAMLEEFIFGTAFRSPGDIEAGVTYRQVETDEFAILVNGTRITPVATLASKAGRVQIAVDDHCYVLYVRTGTYTNTGTYTSKYTQTSHIFNEALSVLKILPPLA